MWLCWWNGVRPSQRLRFIRRVHRGSSDIFIPLGGNGRDPLRLETGRLTRFADGSAQASMGETSVNVTVVSKKSPSLSSSFLPLSVDYRLKSSAAGRIPTNYLRRELGPSTREILISRLIDRSLRPLFPKDYLHETQIVANVLATDGKYEADIASLNGASAALSVSNVPWNGPVGAIRVGTSPDRREIIINPTRSEREKSALNVFLAGTKAGEAVAIEAEGDVVDKHLLVDAIGSGLESCASIAKMIEEWASSLGQSKRTFSPLANGQEADEVLRNVELLTANKLRSLYQSKVMDKIVRDNAMFAILEKSLPSLKESFPHINSEAFSSAFYAVNKRVITDLVLDDGYRVDGRASDEMRPLSCEVDLHAPLHGSALFQRGQTQVLCTVALDSIESSLKNDQMSAITGGVKEKNFFLHYEFPKYATNDVSRSSIAGRRELGHGALAEKALMPLIPKDYPFTIRLTSEVLESNGSSSMATVCGGSLALMDAGIDIQSPAAGVAIGLISRQEEPGGTAQETHLLLDIIGQEDHVGDMDFKIAGTKDGITALQLDVKVPGLSLDIIRSATFLGQEGIREVLGVMNACLSGPRDDKSNLPKTDTIHVPLNKRSKFIGPSGYNVRRITSKTGVRISPGDKEGTWSIFAHNSEALEEAMALIEESLAEEKDIEFTFGALYKVNILELNSSGANVQIHPAHPSVFIPNSQLSATKVSHPSALDLSVGQELLVKCYGRDPVTGNLRLSRKALTVAQSAAVKSLPSKRSDPPVLLQLECTPLRSYVSEGRRGAKNSVLSQAELKSAQSRSEQLERDLRDLTGKLERAQVSQGSSLLSDCYLPSLLTRYKALLSERKKLSEFILSVEGTTHEPGGNMSPPSASDSCLFSDLEENKFYKCIVTAVESNGLSVNVIDEESKVAITGIFIPNAWISKKSVEGAEVGVELSLQFRGVDEISHVPRLVESGSLKRRALPLDNDIPFKTFKPTELFKLDVWSSSFTRIIRSEFHRFLSECSKMYSLRKTPEFFEFFRAQVLYCKDLKRLVSSGGGGPLSKTLLHEIEAETKDIYHDLEYILKTLRQINSDVSLGGTLIKELSHLIESPSVSHLDDETRTPAMFSALSTSLRTTEDHFESVVCHRGRIPGQVLVEFEKADIQEVLRADREVIGVDVSRFVDQYTAYLRRNHLRHLNDWIDYDSLPSFAFHHQEIFDALQRNRDTNSVEDVRIFLNVVDKVPREDITFIMRQWMTPEFLSYITPICREYVELFDKLSEKRKQWWTINPESVSIAESALADKYASILRVKNLIKIASLEVKFFEEVCRILPLKIEYRSVKELDSLLKKASQGDQSASSALLNSIQTFRKRLKDAIVEHFASTPK